MTLAGGTRLGSYEITGPIGAGGMGEVFRARDAGLNRDVAIKVLPAALTSDSDRLARFKREAQVLASLNHPNIAHVYGFEAASLPDGSTAHFLAMELVEGVDLAERLKRGAIPVDEATAIARQIAEGLEEAHAHGIIHRDLKPTNVKVTSDGKVKVLDFGLAKALEGDADASGRDSQLSHSPTMSRHMTEAGMILGTAAYMSPEQARGRKVDKRADLVLRRGVVRDAHRQAALRGRDRQRRPGGRADARARLVGASDLRARRDPACAPALPRERPAEPPSRHRRRAPRSQGAVASWQPR